MTNYTVLTTDGYIYIPAKSARDARHAAEIQGYAVVYVIPKRESIQS
jgi:hypothetical protein